MPEARPIDAPRPLVCVFCEILGGRAPASRVAESAEALAFLTLGALQEGHTLVVPKRHAVEYPDLRPSELAAVFELGADVARRQRRALGSTGETLFLASSEAGEQSVFHLHLHVVPRREGDGVDLSAWWVGKRRMMERGELDGVARRLREG